MQCRPSSSRIPQFPRLGMGGMEVLYMKYQIKGTRGSPRNWLSCSLLLLGLFVALSTSAWAQVTSGSLTGVVSDPTGAVVPGAKVELTDANKGYDYPTTTDAVGHYAITNLLPSSYKLSVEAAGFKTYVRDGIIVDVGTRVTADVRLEVGATTQSVEVTGAAPVLSTQDAETGQEVDRAMINDLPLVDRDVLDLAFLAPGVLQVPGGTYGVGTGLNFVSNGGRNDTAEILVDGVAATSYEPNTNINTILYEPSVEAVQEFKIVQNNFTAEEGFSGNTYINMVLRSGTNKFHGDVYEFLRNDKLDANNWFSNASGGKLPPLRRNQFGGTIGGPIRKDKTFFFFDYDGTREHYGRTSNAGVPSALERTGDFGELCTRIGGSFDAEGMCSDPNGQIWDPYSGYYANSLTVGTGDSAGDYSGRVLQNAIPFNNLITYQSPGYPGLEGTPFQLAGFARQPDRPGGGEDDPVLSRAQCRRRDSSL